MVVSGNINSKLKEKTPAPIPPLQPGDRLTRAEFERRYDATPNLKKAELIEGVVYMPPPVSIGGHSTPHFNIIGWLNNYVAATPGTHGGDNGSLRLDMDNMPQPDAFLRILETHGGQSRIDEDDYLEGAPELIAEISATSASFDLNTKLNVYRRNGVREYLVWRVFDRTIDWMTLKNGEYIPLKPAARDIVKSGLFPGLWLDRPAMVAGDISKVMTTLNKGLASAAHRGFVERLKES